MSIWDLFRKKDKEGQTSESSAGYAPVPSVVQPEPTDAAAPDAGGADGGGGDGGGA